MTSNAATWFYSIDNQRKGPFTPDQISALLTAGAITEHTKVWSEALVEWTPLFRTELRTLLGEKPVAPPEIEPANANVTFVQADPIPAAPSPSHVAYPRYDNRTLGTITRWASMLCAGFSIVPVVQMVKKKTIEEQYALFKFQETDAATIVFGVPLLITMVLFLFWKYRATANLFNVAGRQTITPAGAVYWYFVPVLWFWKPYEAMRNLWNGFGADSKQSYWLGAWWLAWWAGLGVAILAAIVLPHEVIRVSEAKSYVFWNTAIAVIDAASFFFAAEVIKHVSAAESRAMAGTRHA